MGERLLRKTYNRMDIVVLLTTPKYVPCNPSRIMAYIGCYKQLTTFVVMTEQAIQAKRIKQLESQGYYVIKMIKCNKNGLPDILAIPPNTPVIFSEVKTDKGVVSKLQEYRLKELDGYGFKTEVYRGYDK